MIKMMMPNSNITHYSRLQKILEEQKLINNFDNVRINYSLFRSLKVWLKEVMSSSLKFTLMTLLHFKLILTNWKPSVVYSVVFLVIEQIFFNSIMNLERHTAPLITYITFFFSIFTKSLFTFIFPPKIFCSVQTPPRSFEQ